MSFGYVRETAVVFGIAYRDNHAVTDHSARWPDVGRYVSDAIDRIGMSPEQIEAAQPRGDRIGAKTIRKLMRGEVADYRRGNVTKLAEIMGVRNDWLDRLLRGEPPVETLPRLDVESLERRFAAIEARLAALEQPSNVVALPRKTTGARAALSTDKRKPLPKAPRSERTSNRPGPPPEPEGP